MTKLKRLISVLLCVSITLGCVVIGTTSASADSLYVKRTIKVGETYTLWSDTTGTWTTSDEKVAIIDDKGIVHGLSAGVAELKYTIPSQPYSGGGEYVYTFTVEDVKLSKTSLSLYAGEFSALSLDNPSGTVTWSSKNTKIASVSSSGLVKGVSAGSTTITAQYNGKSYTCNVTVKAKPVSISKSAASLTVGNKLTLALSNASGKISWSSSKSKVASVSSKGVVTAKKKGKATVTAKYKNKKYTCKITVKNKKIPSYTFKKSTVIEKGEKIKFTIKKAKASKIKWSAENKKIATVSKGLITAKKAGTTTITAKYGKKTYKSSVRVFATKKLGTKTLTDSKNTATVSKVKVSLDPALLDENAKLTVKKASGLPKLNGASMKTYDFSLEGAKVNKNNVAVIEIPQKVAKNEIPIAGYFNEKTQKWEPVCCDYSNGKISIVANHFSLHGVAAVKKDRSWNIYNDNTTMEKVWSYWAPTSADISGEEALEIVSKTLKKGSVATECVEWGWQKVNDLFDRNVNWNANVFGALGISTKVADFINNNTAAFGAIGFALAYVNAIKYAYNGDHQQAAYTAFNGYSGAVTAAVASKIGTAAISAGCFAITVISYFVTETYSQTLSSNERKWYNYYKYYYQHESFRKPHHWKDILQPIFESGKSVAKIQSEIESEVDKYVEEAWNSEWFAAYFYDATGMNFGVGGGLNKTIMNKLSAEYKDELMNGDIALVYEWYAKKLQSDAENAMTENLKKMADELNKEFKISFYDSSVKKGKKSSLAGWTVRWKKIPSGIKDKENLKLTLNSKGKASTEYTLFAAINYNIKPEVELVSPKGKVKRTITYKITSDTTKIDLKPKTETVSNKWQLTSTKFYSLGLYSYYPDKNTYDLGGKYSDSSVSYNFSSSGNTITTKQTRLDTDETQTCIHTASLSQPASVLTPGQSYTLTESLTLVSKSDAYNYLSGPSVNTKCTGVNPTHEDNPKYPWVVASVGTQLYALSVSAGLSANNAGTTESRQTTFTIPKSRTPYKDDALQKGDVFYIYLQSSSEKCKNFIVYTYTYK